MVPCHQYRRRWDGLGAQKVEEAETMLQNRPVRRNLPKKLKKVLHGVAKCCIDLKRP
jgi:hypothetical protein